MKKEKRPFIPNDKPKSWVIGILSGIAGLLVAGPFLVTGTHYEITAINEIGQLLFFFCWLSCAIFCLIFVVGLSSGKYKNIEQKEWHKQLW
jgi:hypothetical protein